MDRKKKKEEEKKVLHNNFLKKWTIYGCVWIELILLKLKTEN